MIFVRPSEIRCAAPCPGGRKSCVRPLLKVSGGVDENTGGKELEEQIEFSYDQGYTKAISKVSMRRRHASSSPSSSHTCLAGALAGQLSLSHASLRSKPLSNPPGVFKHHPLSPAIPFFLVFSTPPLSIQHYAFSYPT